MRTYVSVSYICSFFFFFFVVELLYKFIFIVELSIEISINCRPTKRIIKLIKKNGAIWPRTWSDLYGFV